MSKEKKRILILAYLRKNLGDDIFVAMLLNRYPNIDFDIYCTVNPTANIYKKPFEKYKNLKNWCVNNELSSIKIEDYDGFVFIAGSMFTERKGDIERKQIYIDFIKNCRLQGKPFYCISCNFGPYQTEEYKKVSEEMISSCTDVCFRDKYSKECFEDVKTARYAPDIVLSSKFKTTKQVKDTVGISVLSLTKIMRECSKEYCQAYLDMLKNNIVKFIKEGKTVYLFSFCQHEGDEKTIAEIISKVPEKYHDKLKKVLYRGNLESFLLKYSKMEYMLCTRFHSLILSLKLQQKVMVVSYNQKLEHLLSDMETDIPIYLVDDRLKNVKLNLNKFKAIEKERIESIEIQAREQLTALDEFVEGTLQSKIKNDYKFAYPTSLARKIVRKVVPKKIRKVIKNKIVKPKKKTARTPYVGKHKEEIAIVKQIIDAKKNFESLAVLVDRLHEKTLSKEAFIDCMKQAFEINEKTEKNLVTYCNKQDTLKVKKLKVIKNKPLISIVIPTYNREGMLKECLDSILMQDYDNYEIIIVDDHSSDGTKEMIENEYNLPFLQYYYNEKNMGPGYNRNFAYKKSKGEYVIFLDDDDYYIDTNFFTKAVNQYAKLNKDKIAFVSFLSLTKFDKTASYRYRPFNLKGEVPNDQYLRYFQGKSQKPNSTFTTLFNRRALEEMNFSNMEMANDSAIYLVSLLAGNGYIAHDIVGIYRMHGNNITKGLNAKFIIDNLKEKKFVYENIKEKEIFDEYEEWWYEQVLLTCKYFIYNSKPERKEFKKIIKWCNQNTTKYRSEMKKAITGFYSDVVHKRV